MTLPGLLPELEVIRKDFPILERTLAGGFPLVYLDSANTSQKPQVVIDAMVDHRERHHANVARALHHLGAESTEGVNRFSEDSDKGVLLITHYTRILRYITPDYVHVFVNGKIAEQGGPELADQLEAEGYDKYVQAGADAR